MLDYFHVTEYFADVAHAAYPAKTGKPQREKWLHEHCVDLKHKPNAVETFIVEMDKLLNKKSLSKTVKENLSKAHTYFVNHRKMMDYASHVKQHLPIGSGVAACKTLVKQRLCCSGMRWKTTGAKVVLSLRALVQSKGRWQQFWSRIDQYGTHVCV